MHQEPTFQIKETTVSGEWSKPSFVGKKDSLDTAFNTIERQWFFYATPRVGCDARK